TGGSLQTSHPRVGFCETSNLKISTQDFQSKKGLSASEPKRKSGRGHHPRHPT
ncbi:hypothetical protein SK128_023169, partial [Halocaridina rubra]